MWMETSRHCTVCYQRSQETSYKPFIWCVKMVTQPFGEELGIHALNPSKSKSQSGMIDRACAHSHTRQNREIMRERLLINLIRVNNDDDR